MDINPSEVTKILKEQIKKFGDKAEVTEVGQVLSVGDGIARVYGLDNVQAGEMVEFSDGSRGMALNLESGNVGVVEQKMCRLPSFVDISILMMGKGRIIIIMILMCNVTGVS